jgi:hypothetical protein
LRDCRLEGTWKFEDFVDLQFCEKFIISENLGILNFFIFWKKFLPRTKICLISLKNAVFFDKNGGF